MLKVKLEILKRIDTIDNELKELKELVRQLDDESTNETIELTGNKQNPKITKNYIVARDWAKKTLKLKL